MATLPRHRRSILIVVIGIALILAAGCTQPSSEQQKASETTVVNMTVPFGPVPVESTDGVNIAYELELKNAENTTLVPEQLEVLDPATGKVLYTEDRGLLASLYHPAAVPPPTYAELQNGTPKLPLPRISIWFVVSPGAVPDRLTHRLVLNRTANGLPPLTLTGGNVTVRKDLAPVVVGSPVKGPGWLALETTSPMTHHFSAQVTLNGVTRVPQRYAQDYLYVDPVTGEIASGNDTIARNYYGFGKELYAVANGTVIDVRNDAPDIEITTEKPPASVDTAAGNFVILDIGNRKYACYAHMINGSVRVKPGDKVVEGQVIGLMGNSGNSDAPHLHFQVVTDNPVFLGGEGYPLVYCSFNVTGTFNESSTGAIFFKEPFHQENRLMENYVIVSFP